MLLSRVYKEQELMDKAVEALVRARDAQTDVLARARVEAGDQMGAQREVAAEINFRLAVDHELQRDPDQALTYYQEALKHNDAHEKAILALARLHLVRGELETAQQQCTTLMRVEPAEGLRK